MLDVSNGWEYALGVNILKQAFLDWELDIQIIKRNEDGRVRGLKRTVEMAKGDMITTKNFVESGLATVYTGIDKSIIREQFQEKTPKELLEMIKWL